MEHTNLSAKIADYIASRAKPKLEALEKKEEKERKKTQDPEALNKLELELSEERQKLEEKFAPANWLTDAACRAKQICFVTHPIKYSNSLIKGGSSCYAAGGSKQPASMLDGEILSTASLLKVDLDVVGNAAALDVAALLQLEYDGKTLIEYIREKDSTPLQAFADSDEQLTEWLDGFSQVLLGGKLSSHKLAKQLYFPIDEDKYHLLSPLYPSSLVHAVHGRIAATRSKEAKLTRKARWGKKYSGTIMVDYPNTAIQTFGGANAQNVSQLNKKRGRSFLLSCAPPNWQSQAKPPFGIKTVFSRNHFGLRVGKETWFLRNYLEQQVEKDSTVTIRNRRAEMIDELIDHLIQYGAEIQNFKEHAGWSGLPECKLSFAEQLWLDPNRARNDEVFAQERQKNDWQAVIADHFAFWLNNRIKSKKLTPGDVEHREWKSLLVQKLRLLKEDLEVFA